MKLLKHLFLFFWELPQNLAGVMVLGILILIKKNLSTRFTDGHLLTSTPSLGVSLGRFVFYPVCRQPHTEMRYLHHEMGHARQSVFLGPMYLIVVGIPSAGRYLYDWWYRKRKGKAWPAYYNGFPENWADRLGNGGQLT